LVLVRVYLFKESPTSFTYPDHAIYYIKLTHTALIISHTQEDAGADAFLRAVDTADKAWIGHEPFLITAPTIDIAPDAPADAAALKTKFWPNVPVREGFLIEGRSGFYDCSKAKRLLGWKHPSL
jgi:nucleoside-diphosphate-sugar epimerase